MSFKVIVLWENAGADQFLLQGADEVQQVFRLAAANVIDGVGGDGKTVAADLLFRGTLHDAEDPLHDVVNIGEVTAHIAVVENPDGLTGCQFFCSAVIEHIRAAGRAVYREESETCGRNVVKLAVSMGEKFVAFFGGGIETYRVVHSVIGGEGDFFVAAVDGGTGSIDQMLDRVMAAGFEDIEKAKNVAFHIDIRVVDAVADTGLGGEVHDDGGAMCFEDLIEQSLIGQIAPDEDMFDGRVRGGVSNIRQAPFLEADFVIIVHVVEADNGAGGHLFQKADDQVGPDKSRGSGNQDRFSVQINRCFYHGSIPPKEVAGIDLFLDIIQDGIIAVGDDAAALPLKLLQVVDDFAAEEGGAVLEGGLVDDDRCALGLDALHDALDGGLAEVVAVRLHGQTVDADCDALLPRLFVGGEGLTVSVGAGDVEDTVGNEVLAGAVALDNGLDQILRYVLIIREELLGVLGQAVAAVAEGRIVVIVADAGIQADALDDLGGVEAFDLGIGIQFIEIRDAESEIGIHEELGGFRLRQTHEEGCNRVFHGTLLKQTGEGAGVGFRGFIVADDDAAGIEVVIQGFGFPQELRAEEDIVHTQLFADVDGIADRDGGLDDDRRLRFMFRGAGFDQGQDGFDSGTVKEVGFGVIIGGDSNNDEIGIGIGGGAVGGCGQGECPSTVLRLGKEFLDIVILNRRTEAVDHLCLLRLGADGGDRMMLREQHGKGKTNIADTGNGDSVGVLHRDSDSVLFDIQIDGIKVQGFGKGLQLFDGRREVLRLQTGEQTAVNAGEFRELSLGQLFFLAAGFYGFSKQGKR